MNNTLDINPNFTNDEITNEAIEKLIVMSKDGTLESLIEIITFIVAMKNSMTTEMIVKITQLIPDPALISKLEKTIKATKETKEELINNNPKIGLFGLLSILKDPDIQYLLNYLLLVGKKVSKIVKE